jgi:hypothetical protein
MMGPSLLETDEAIPASAKLEINSVEADPPLKTTKMAKDLPPIRNIGGTTVTTTNGMVKIAANTAVEGTTVRIVGNSRKTRTYVLSNCKEGLSSEENLPHQA